MITGLTAQAGIEGMKFKVAALLATTALALTMGAMPVHAQDAAKLVRTAQAEGTRSFDIPAGSLNDALTAYGQQAQMQVSVESALVRGVSSPGITGRMSPQEALSRLLTGTGFTYRRAGDAVTLEKLPPSTTGAIQLGPVRVEGNTAPTPKTDQAATDRSHSYAARAATVAGKTPQKLREIPQSVTVVTRQRMDDQNAVTIEQALRNTTGVTSVPLSPLAGFFYVRGYSAEVQYDGIPSNAGISNVGQYDSAIYDRIEVLRGPSGLLQGAGAPAGTINLVRKRPHEAFGWAGSLMGASWNNFHGDVDVTGPLNSSGSVRGRLVAAGQDRDFFINEMHERHSTIYGIVEADLDENTTLTLSGTNEDKTVRSLNFGQSVYAVPPDGQFLNAPRSTFFGVAGTPDSNNKYETYTALDHDLGNGWAMRASAEYRYASDNGQSSSLRGPVSLTNIAPRIVYSQGLSHSGSATADFNVHGPVELFGRTHTLLLGTNYAYFDTASYGGSVNIAPILDIYNIKIPVQNIPLSSGQDTRTQQWGAYGQARISISDPLTLVVGGRFTNYQSKSRSGFPALGAWQPAPDVDGHFTPSVGVLYDISSEITLYGSYATIFVPQAGAVFGGGTVKPRTGEQFEVGAKGEFFSGALNVSAAIFNLTDRNRAVQDFDHSGAISYFVTAGKVRSKGVELEASGEVLPGWSIFGGYTYLETKYIDDPSNLGAIFDLEEPRHSLKLWTTYRFGPTDEPGFQVGAGLRVLSETTRGGPTQPAYGVADAMVGYRFDGQWSAALTVNNALDQKYYIRVPSTFFGNYGEPRSFTISLRKSF